MKTRIVKLILLAAFCFSSALTNYAARNEIPFQAPPALLDFLKSIDQRLLDMIIDFGAPPSDWTNPPVAPGSAGVVEDDLFLIRFPPEKSGLGDYLLKIARSNVSRLEKLFGWYPYPRLHRNRRLEVNLSLNDAVCRGPCGAATLGLCKTVFHPAEGKIFIEGIYLKPSLCEEWQSGQGFRNKKAAHLLQTVLAHEITHAVYFTGLNFRNAFAHPEWLVEGIADYGGQSTWRLEDRYPQALRSPLGDRDAWSGAETYWVGYTAHLALECRHGEAAMHQYLHTLLTTPLISDALRVSLNLGLPEWNSSWSTMVRHNAFSIVPPPGQPFQCR